MHPRIRGGQTLSLARQGSEASLWDAGEVGGRTGPVEEPLARHGVVGRHPLLALPESALLLRVLSRHGRGILGVLPVFAK